MTLKQLKLKQLSEWLGISQTLVNEMDSDAISILSSMTAKQLRVVSTMVKGGYAKGYRDRVSHSKDK